MDTLRRDLRDAVHTLLRSPGFSTLVVLGVGLAISLTTAIFSVAYGVALRPLDFPDPDRLVAVWEWRDGERRVVAPAEFVAWRSQAGAFERIAAFVVQTTAVAGGADPEQIKSARVSAGFFEALGVSPSAGRTFASDEEGPAGEDVIVVSEGFWRRRLGSVPFDSRTITLDGRAVEIVGVMPATFDYPEDAEVWQPLSFQADAATLRRLHYLWVVGRLRPDASLETAETELAVIAERLADDGPANGRHGAAVVRLHDQIVGDVRPALLLLLVAVGCVLLLACANVATLLLARAARRDTEIAMRAALGASRARLLRQLLTEGVVLAALGGATGLLLAYGSLGAILRLAPADMPRLRDVAIDPVVLGFTAFVSLGAGILFSLAPAVHASRPALVESLRESGRGPAAGGAGRHRLQQILVAAQFALALVLAAGAGLMIQSFARLRAVDPGFRADDVLTVELVLPRARYPQPHQVSGFYDRLEERLEALPAVRGVGAVLALPLGGSRGTRAFLVDGRPEPTPGEAPRANSNVVRPGYFAAMGIPILTGRDFSAQDAADRPPVVIINSALARRFWPEPDAIGRRIRLPDGHTGGVEASIVGVVGDVRHTSLTEAAEPEIYVPHGQFSSLRMTVVIRTDGDPVRLTGDVRSALRTVDPELTSRIRPLDEVVAGTIAQPRVRAALLGLFGGAAGLLATLGLFGVVSYAVALRAPEIGIRLALGAQSHDIIALVVGREMRWALGGMVAGLAGTLVVTRAIAAMLYGAGPADATVLAGITGLLVVTALAATYLPARRATQIDPTILLRRG